MAVKEIHPGLQEILDRYISGGSSLVETLQSKSFLGVSRIDILKKRIESEIQFLEKVRKALCQDPGSVKKEHVICSNIVNMTKHVEFLQSGIQPSSVLTPFQFVSKRSGRRKIVMDIVAGEGMRWYKIIARNPKSLHRSSLGDCEFGQRSILTQAKEYVVCSKQNLVNYDIPQVTFVFSTGVTSHLARKLEDMGVQVIGERVEYTKDDNESASDSDTSSQSDTDEEPLESPEQTERDQRTVQLQCVVCSDSSESIRQCLARISFDFDSYEKSLKSGDGVCLCSRASANRDNCLNMDITAMVVKVSSLTNGGNLYRFKEKIIAEQANWERVRPAKERLDKICEGHHLVVCEKAVEDFIEIMSTISGEGERRRAREFLARMTFVKDSPSRRALQLKCTGSISERGKIIFGTGDYLRIVTVSANTGFVRSAASQGVRLAFIQHEPRVLTEKKEKTAEPL